VTSPQLRDLLELNMRMHDAHSRRIDNLWRAIALLALMSVLTIMAICVMGVK
jgi:hypothetical protein